MKNYVKRLERRFWQKLNKLQKLYLKSLAIEFIIGIVLLLKLNGVLNNSTPFVNQLDHKEAIAKSLSIMPSDIKCEFVYSLAQKGNLKTVSADSLVFICSKSTNNNLQAKWVRTDIKKICVNKEDDICTHYDIKVIRYKILRNR